MDVWEIPSKRKVAFDHSFDDNCKVPRIIIEQTQKLTTIKKFMRAIFFGFFKFVLLIEVLFI